MTWISGFLIRRGFLFIRYLWPSGVTSRWLRLWEWAWAGPPLDLQGRAKQKPPKTWADALGSTSWFSTVRTRWISEGWDGSSKVRVACVTFIWWALSVKVGYLVKIYFSTFGYILGSSFNFLELFGKPESYQRPVDETSISFAFRNVPLSLPVAYLQIKCHIVSCFGGRSMNIYLFNFIFE